MVREWGNNGGLAAQASGTFTLANNTNEQTAITWTAPYPCYWSLEILDCTALAQANTIRVKRGGIVLDSLSFVVGTTPAGVYFRAVAVSGGQTITVTMQAGTGEGASRSIPYAWLAEGI